MNNVDAFLEHHGVKGQKWGIRNEEKPDHSKRNKRIALVLGGAIAAGAIAAGALYLKKRMNVKINSIPKANPLAENFTKSLADEPAHIIHAARGRIRGHVFLQGGTNSLHEFEQANLETADHGLFKRYGKRAEKVAVAFADPNGRKDRAGRRIIHTAILPESMAKDVHNFDDAVKVAWPRLKHLFNAFYESKPDTLGPGF